LNSRTAIVLCLLLPLLGFAQEPQPARLREVPPPNERLFVNTEGNVRVTTAVPSAEEADAIFGVKLYRQNIQPVWVKVENLGEERLWFLPMGLDTAYFTPIETSYRLQNRIPLLDLKPEINEDLYRHTMGLQVDGGDSRSGYIFSRLDQGTKSFNVDVVGRNTNYSMSFFIPVPGLKLDHYKVDWHTLYEADQIRDVTGEDLHRELAAMPCCVTDKKGKNLGDPLNIAVIGDVQDVYYAFMRSGWDETETIYTGSLWRTLKSTLSGSEYRYSPVSALYVFGRPQDVALQKARTSIDERNHLRLWLTPLRYADKPVWIGQISRDIGVRFTKKTITTHKIDPDVDETREYLLEDLAYAQSLKAFGYVPGVGPAEFEEPRGNLTGDPYFTDGRRIVLFVSSEPIDIAELQTIDFGVSP
jgi:hypothetical protein